MFEGPGTHAGEYRRAARWACLGVACLLTGCELPTPGSHDPLAPEQAERISLTAAEIDEQASIGLVDNRHYAGIGGYGPALHQLEGTFRVAETPMHSTGRNESYGVSGLRYFPGFSAQFFTHGEFLVPASRGVLSGTGGESYWKIILSPGRVWSEAPDGGRSRASFPFALVSNVTNEAHNGIATFLFDDARVSSIYFQVVQETAPWNRHDYWGRLEAEYLPGQVEARLRTDFDLERDRMIPTADWSELAGPHDWAQFTRGLQASDVSAAGIIVDGTIYMRNCATRHGDLPYCEFARHGAFSLTKSMAAAVALLRLAQKYGDSVSTLLVRDYIDTAALYRAWHFVTFADLLNMAVGVGGNNGDATALDPFADETPANYAAWIGAAGTQEKLSVALAAPRYEWGPGRVFRYNTAHTFVLAVAMDNLLKSLEGPEAEIWKLLEEEVFRPIGIAHAPTMRTTEADGSEGLPLLGIGLYPSIDDVAKIVTLLQNGGLYGGQQILSPTLLADALFQTGKGLPTGERTAYGDARYHLSFWSLPYKTKQGCPLQLAYMNGFGGNFVMLLPNGLVSFRFADAELYDVEPLATVAEGIRPFSCQTP